MMQRIRLTAALLLLAAPGLGAQQKLAAEVGIFGQFSKYDDFTGLKNGLAPAPVWACTSHATSA